MVTNIVRCECKGTIGCPKCNGFLGRMDRRQSTSPCIKKTRSQTSMTFNAILKVFLTPCSFCVGKEKLINIRRPLLEEKWRETNNRKILAPLTFKQNADNIIAGNLDMTKKRKSDVDAIWKPLTKRIKLDNNNKINKTAVACTYSRNFAARKLVPNSLVLRRECLYRKSFVKLFDVLREIPFEKEEEMSHDRNAFAGLLMLRSNEQSTRAKATPDVKANHPVRLASHTNIPFSSDYGRQLLIRERHCLPRDVALRKIERTEWYLKEPAAIARTRHGPEVAYYDKKIRHAHRYKFPKRQFYQNRMSLKRAFLLYAIRPVRVEIERIDVAGYLKKKMEDDGTTLPTAAVAAGGADAVPIVDARDDNGVSFTDRTASPCQINDVLSDEEATPVKTGLHLLLDEAKNKNIRRSARVRLIVR